MGRDGQPFSTENLIASVVEALKVRGDARGIAVLVAGQCHMALWDSDFGIDSWRLFVALPVHLYYAISEDDRKATEMSIAEVVGPFFSTTPQDALESVVMTPHVTEAADG
jgi:hypothetical protein